MRKIGKKIYMLLFTLAVVILPLNVNATTHDFSLKLYDFDVTANDWEGAGTEDPIPDNGTVKPGQIFKVDLYYIAPQTIEQTMTMQTAIDYDRNILEPIWAPHEDGVEDDVYVEVDMTTTAFGGIWPPKGTTAVTKKQTNWTVQYHDYKGDADPKPDPNDPQPKITFLITDSQLAKPLTAEGVLASVYFKVKDDVANDTAIDLHVDYKFTKATGEKPGGLPKTTHGVTLKVAADVSSDVSLKTLTFTGNNGVAYPSTPAFTSGTSDRTFSLIVPNKVSTLDIAAEPTDSTTTVLASTIGTKSLSVGDNSFDVTVQAADGTQEIYTVKVKRLSNDTSLKTLSLTNVTLDYELSSSVFTYSATVPYTTTATTVNATTTHSNATVSGTGAWNLSDYGATINTKKLTVNAEDCASTYASVLDNSCTSKEYTLNVTRQAPSSDNGLDDLKVDGTTVTGFNKTTTSYTLDNQPNNKTSINITATASDSKATVTGTGSKTLNLGDNTFTVKVTAEDGSENSYEIHVRRLSNNANLASLSVTSNPQGTLSPSFTPTLYDYYTYTYDSTVSTINIAATLEDSTNASIVSGTGNYSSSDTQANIVTTAEDGTTKTYIVKFSRNKSSDNDLKSLSIDGYTLNETFAPGTTLYTATIPGTVDSINVNAEANDSNATIVSGTGSHSLNYGANTIQVRVKAENGAEKDYTITVTRSKKDISALSDLTVDGTTVTGFSETVLSYNIGTVPFSKTSISIGAVAKDSDATITGTGTVNLDTGSNSFNVVVTAHNGTTKTTYTINVEREKSDNTYLSSLTLAEKSFTFNKTTKTYDVDVPFETTTATITATPEYQDATATVSGPNFLSVGKNTYTITVTAENGDVDTYTLNITRGQSTNTSLAGLTVTHGSTSYITFNPTQKEYNVTVPNEVDNVDINAVLSDSTTQTVTGTGNKTLQTGLNPFSVVVSAASGSTNEYKINITREKNNNTNLSSLVVVDQTLSPAFKPGTTGYTVNVASNINNIMITATPEVATSKVTGTGNKTISTGVNTFTVTVEAEDGSTKDYTILVTRQASSDSSLASLSINETSLNETFVSTKTDYTASVSNNIDKVTINATANDPKAKSVTGTGVVNLTTGDNTISVVVTAEDNTTTTYTIKINRAKSDNAFLREITLSDGYSLVETFNKNTFNYTANVPNSVSKITVAGDPEDSKATVTGDGLINLSTGSNTVTIVVTAEDGVATKTYTVEIKRAKSSDATLKSLTSTNGLISPTFTKGNKDYTLTVPNEVENATINAVSEDSNATVVINGVTNLTVGTNPATVVVTAEDGTVETYNIVITRQPSSNNYLSNLEVIDKNNVNYIPVFNKTKLTYDINVANDIDSVTITATEEDSSTTITGDGVKSLNVGPNTFTVKATSGDGVDRNYVINIERAKNGNAQLKSLGIDGQTLVPDFAPNHYSYTLNVDASVNDVNITAKAEASTTTVTGDGTKTLVTGLNTFNIEVEAEDGSKNTYVIIINKAASSNNYLASLLLDQPFAPTFDRDTLDYSATVANSVTTVDVQGIAEDPNATVTGNGVQNLDVGHNNITITVTAENNTFRVYTIDVYREPSDNNYLSDLKVDGTTVNLFSREKTNYTMTVENNTLEVDVTPVLEDPNATVTGGGVTQLVTGLNTINIVVTAQNGQTKVYTIEVTRKQSSNNFLAMLSTLEGTISPAFTKENNNYTMKVPYEVVKLTLTTVAEDANAKVTIEGNNDFSVGDSNMVTIKVEAEDGSINTYEIKVERLPQANNFLSSLTVTSSTGKSYALDPVFEKNTLNYSITVDENDSRLTIDGVMETSSSTIAGLGDIDVTVFPYNHQVIVTSASGVDRVYTITINRAKSSNADLKDLTVSEGILTPAFDKDELSYTVNVGSTVSSIDIAASLNKGQTVVGDGTHNLEYGDNIFPVVVTAEDGTSKTYTVKVVREQQVSAELADIEVTNGSLTPTFASGITDYIAFMGEGATNVTITPKVKDLLSEVSMSLNDGPYDTVSSITATDLTQENTVRIKVKGTDQEIIYTVYILNQADEKITSDAYGHDISDGMIKTVAIDTSVEQMKDQLDNENSRLKIYQSDGVTEYIGDKIGTGMIVKLFKGSIVVDQKVIVVKGDTDGTGVIDAIDALKVVNHIIENEFLSGCYKEAAETTNDDTINAIDALRIVNHIIGTIPLY